MRQVLLLAIVLSASACRNGGGAVDADSSGDPAGEPDADADGTDGAADTATDTPRDTSTDPVDVGEDEVASVCGNLEVEPGEDCDPPGATTVCETACGTFGTGECGDSCHAPAPDECDPPGETCNLSDDDCDGLADEGTVAAWGEVATLSPGGGASGDLVDVVWTGEAYAALWLAAGTTDELRMAVVDAVGDVTTAETAVPLAPGAVAGRPSVAWTGSRVLASWTGAAQRHVAVLGTDASVDAHATWAAAGPGPGAPIAWSGSHAAIAWVEQVSGRAEVHVAFVAADATEASSPVAITSGADASEPAVDAAPAGVLVSWVDARAGSAQLWRAVLDHDGSTIAPAAAVTTTGSVTDVAASASAGLLAWTDGHDGTARVYTLALDTAWLPAASPVAVAPGASVALASGPERLAVASGGLLATLEPDGTLSGAAVGIGVDPAAALAWGDLAAAAAGASGSDLALALTGCTAHERCDSWHRELATTGTRTGWDGEREILAHEGAFEGTFASRPVTYVSIQIREGAPYHGPDTTGTMLLAGAAYETCGLCVLVYEGCGTSACARTYLARSGTLVIDEIGVTGDVFGGTLVGAQLAEVAIDSSTGESTWVEDGREVCIGSYAFSETITAI